LLSLNQIQSIVAHDLTTTSDAEIYAIEYKYDGKGRKVRQTIWNSRTDSKPQYDISYQYDSRDQLLNEKYLRYNASTFQMEVVRERTYTYDNGGSLVKKTIKHENLWIEHTFAYSRGYHIVDWDWAIATGTGTPTSGTVSGITYDANGNLTAHGAITITGDCLIFSLASTTFTYDRKNRLKTYRFGSGTIYTLYWDAIGRIREKTWTIDSTAHKQVFYHDGRKLVQIWNETSTLVPPFTTNFARAISYDLYRGQTGYLKDIDFDANPDVESYLIKDEQGTVRAAVTLGFSAGAYNVTVDRDGLTDAYGDSLGSISDMTDTHYMRYISCRVEGYGDESNENQALVHTDHRHYLPYLGIFLQREPLLVGGSVSSIKFLPTNPLHLTPYRYSGNKPSNSKDPSGYINDNDCDVLLMQAYLKRISCSAKCYRAYEAKLAEYDNELSEIGSQISKARAAMLLAIAGCAATMGVGPLLGGVGEKVNEALVTGIYVDDAVLLARGYGTVATGSAISLGLVIISILVIRCIAHAIERFNQTKEDLERSRLLWFCLKRNARVELSNCYIDCQRIYCNTLAPCMDICTESDELNQQEKDGGSMIDLAGEEKICCSAPDYLNPEDCVKASGGPYNQNSHKHGGILGGILYPSWPGDPDYWWEWWIEWFIHWGAGCL
jgi:YD repeat-containing protein